MKNLSILGFGSGSENSMSLATLEKLQNAKKVYVRTIRHPGASILEKYHIVYESFDELYDQIPDFDELYETIAQKVLGSSEDDVAYIVTGSPVFAEKSVQLILLKNDPDWRIHVEAAVSFLDGIFASLAFDGAESFKLIDGLNISAQKPDPTTTNVICQIYDTDTASDVKLELMKTYTDDTPVLFIHSAGTIDSIVESIPLFELDRSKKIGHLSSLVIKPVSYLNAPGSFGSLVEIFEILRGENGCEWDKAQTHESLKPYLIEETYEVLDSIDGSDPYVFCEELGDLLLQIMLHSQISAELGNFDIYDVIRTLNEKLVRRHPHVFSGKSAENLEKLWESVKQEEHHYERIAEKMDGIPKALPAAMYAQKVQVKAQRAGFDFDDAMEAIEKIYEEVNELKQAIESSNSEEIADECADLLFSAINVTRLLKLDSEILLKKSTQKFMNRFRLMEELIYADMKTLEVCKKSELDYYWEMSKKNINNFKMT
jgi:tetrapyrrole methylase family protein/MazG family protein